MKSGIQQIQSTQQVEKEGRIPPTPGNLMVILLSKYLEKLSLNCQL